MDIFYALADPNRRKIIELLSSAGPLTATQICSHFPVSPPAISQHLKVLREAGLVRMEKQAQQRVYRLNPGAMLELEDWARQLAEVWTRRYTALEAVLEREQHKLSGS